MQGTVKELSFMESFMFLWLHWVDARGGGAYLRSWEEPPSLKPNVTEMSRLRWKTNHFGEKEENEKEAAWARQK